MNDDIEFLARVARLLASAGRPQESLKLFAGLTALSGRKSYYAEGVALASRQTPAGSEAELATAIIRKFGFYCCCDTRLIKALARLCWLCVKNAYRPTQPVPPALQP